MAGKKSKDVGINQAKEGKYDMFLLSCRRDKVGFKAGTKVVVSPVQKGRREGGTKGYG